MKVYHVIVEQDEEWLVGQVLERPGVTTQGRSLDELVYMVRDAIDLMWGERDVHLELVVPRKTVTAYERRRSARLAKRPRRVKGMSCVWMGHRGDKGGAFSMFRSFQSMSS